MTTHLSRLRRVAAVQRRLKLVEDARLAAAAADQNAAIREHEIAIENASGANPNIEAAVAARFGGIARAHRRLTETAGVVASRRLISADAGRLERQLGRVLESVAVEAKKKADLELLSDLIDRNGSWAKKARKGSHKDGRI